MYASRIILILILCFCWNRAISSGEQNLDCLSLGEQKKIYVITVSSVSLVFIDNVFADKKREEKNKKLVKGNEAIIALRSNIVPATLEIDEHSAPPYTWKLLKNGYSLWLDEEFVCKEGKPPVYDLQLGRHRDPFF